MADRRKVEEKIKKKEQEIQELEGRLREARVYVQALHDVLKMFPKDTPEADAEAILRPGSAVAQARELILKQRRALHISDILKGLGREVNRVNRAALGGSISAYVRKGLIFTKEAPNTFGLVEIRKKEDGEDPPSDFGTDETGNIELN